MKAVEASAPGKVVIAGEYAVLHGAPAIVMAVDRRAAVRLEPAAGPVSVVRGLGLAAGRHAFRPAGSGIEWVGGRTGFRLLEAAWSAAVAPPGAVEIVLDTTAFAAGPDGRKLGIGSSAALTVALVAALAEAAGADIDVAAAAHAAHRAFQDDAGSGADVAAALAGGLIQYSLQGSERRTLAWPSGIAFALYWSGVPADTRAGIRAYRAKASPATRAALAAAAECTAAAWAQGDVTGILAETRGFARELARFDAELDLGIFAAGHRELAAAAPAGVVYKPCGAGGGDIGIALAAAADELCEFTARAAVEGFRQLPVVLDACGVTAGEAAA